MKKYIIMMAAMVGVLSLTGCLKEDTNYSIGTPSPYIAIEDVSRMYTGTDVLLDPAKMQQAHKITGIVISDASARNVRAGTVIIQNRQRGLVRGIALSVGDGATVPFAIGDSVVADIAGTTLTRVNGSLQISGVDVSKVTKVSSGKTVEPQQISLAQLANNFLSYEGTLVRIVGANITPAPVSGDTYSGSKGLDDGSGAIVKLQTELTATFAANRVPANASFTGIATFSIPAGTKDTTRQIRLRNLADVANASGPLYTGYPEDFEVPDQSLKASYAAANIALRTGQWRLDQAILANTSGRDRFNPAGKQCIRMQQNLSTPAYLQMNYDLPNGATKVTIAYGAYYTDASSTWRLEYSQNQGTTWIKTGSDISDAPNGTKTATFLMNIQGPVRFRVNKLGLGTTNNTSILNGRLSIEDFAIYSN